MLQSKFAKKNAAFKAQKLFTDRVEPRAVFAASIAAIGEKPREIINYYGKGGIGKTTLLRNLVANSSELYAKCKPLAVSNVFVSLDAFEYGNPVNILTGIRNGIQGDCGLFDYAMTQYYAKARLTIEEIKNKNNLLASPVVSILNEAISLATSSACIPASILDKCVSLIKDMRLRAKYREEIAEIATLSEFDLFEHLPYYLGLCVNNAFEKGKFHVIFLDSYESLLNRTVGGTPSTDHEDWLKEFFLSCENVRIVIASRDRLRWDRQDADWGEFLNLHRLQDLSEEDSLWFLEQVPVAERDVAEKIARHAGGVPLYLDMCVDMYESAKNRGEPFDVDALGGKGIITERYMRHLPDRDRYAIKVLAVPRAFDLHFAQELLAKQNLAFSADELKDLFDKSVILPLNEEETLFKVDESVRSHVLERMDSGQKGDILDSLLDCIDTEKGVRSFPYFAAALETLTGDLACFERLYDKIFQRTEFYATAGYWRELQELLGKYTEAENPKLRAVAVVAELICLRRCGNLEEADRFAQAHPLTKEDAGKWYYLYLFLSIHVRHLSGRYDESLEAYRALLDEMDLIRHSVPAHVYNLVAVKYADLLFLKGNFEESLHRTEALLAEPGLSTDDKLELIRLKGHNYRFRRMNKEAELIYASALRLAEEHGIRSANGKFYTNMAETVCYDKPLEALDWYKKAVDENGRLENGIELGKAYAAGAVAYARVNDFDRAIEAGEKALAEAERTRYHSGRAFALAALTFVYRQAGMPEKSAACLEEMKALLRKLNVYLYIIDWFEKDERGN